MNKDAKTWSEFTAGLRQAAKDAMERDERSAEVRKQHTFSARATLDGGIERFKAMPSDHPRHRANLPPDAPPPAVSIHTASVGIGIGSLGVWGSIQLMMKFDDGTPLEFSGEWGGLATPFGYAAGGNGAFLYAPLDLLYFNALGVHVDIQMGFGGFGVQLSSKYGALAGISAGGMPGLGFMGGGGEFSDPTIPH